MTPAQLSRKASLANNPGLSFHVQLIRERIRGKEDRGLFEVTINLRPEDLKCDQLDIVNHFVLEGYKVHWDGNDEYNISW